MCTGTDLGIGVGSSRHPRQAPLFMFIVLQLSKNSQRKHMSPYRKLHQQFPSSPALSKQAFSLSLSDFKAFCDSVSRSLCLSLSLSLSLTAKPSVTLSLSHSAVLSRSLSLQSLLRPVSQISWPWLRSLLFFFFFCFNRLCLSGSAGKTEHARGVRGFRVRSGQ
jgi:hypothetical protein